MKEKSEMYYPKCPYCGKSDGNDDIIINEELVYKDNQECKFITEKQCDICGKKYRISTMYGFDYWNYEE